MGNNTGTFAVTKESKHKKEEPAQAQEIIAFETNAKQDASPENPPLTSTTDEINVQEIVQENHSHNGSLNNKEDDDETKQAVVHPTAEEQVDKEPEISLVQTDIAANESHPTEANPPSTIEVAVTKKSTKRNPLSWLKKKSSKKAPKNAEKDAPAEAVDHEAVEESEKSVQIQLIKLEDAETQVQEVEQAKPHQEIATEQCATTEVIEIIPDTPAAPVESAQEE